jgi:hypothetical protein
MNHNIQPLPYDVNLVMPRAPIIGVWMTVKASGGGRKKTFYPKICVKLHERLLYFVHLKNPY